MLKRIACSISLLAAAGCSGGGTLGAASSAAIATAAPTAVPTTTPVTGTSTAPVSSLAKTMTLDKICTVISLAGTTHRVCSNPVPSVTPAPSTSRGSGTIR